MDLVRIIVTLWQRRVWVAVVAVIAFAGAMVNVYHVGLAPPSLEKKSIEFGAAQTQIMIDTPNSALVRLSDDIVTLGSRASIFSSFLSSEPVQKAISKEAGVPEGVIAVNASTGTPGQTQSGKESSADQRANELIKEGLGYSVTFGARPQLPVILINTQAPSGEQAVKLADAAAAGVRNFVTSTQEEQNIAPGARMVVRQLGSATGGTVNEGASKLFTMLIFMALFIIGCVLVVLFSSLGSTVKDAVGAARLSLNGETNGTTAHTDHSVTWEQPVGAGKMAHTPYGFDSEEEAREESKQADDRAGS